MHTLKSRFDQIWDLEENINNLQKELDACTDSNQRDELQKQFDLSIKKTVAEFKTIFAEGPLSEETFFEAKALYEEAGQSNNKIEWLYSMLLYLDPEENGGYEFSETPFSNTNIAYIPELAEGNATNNPQERLEILNSIAESLRNHVSKTLSTFNALLTDAPKTAVGDDAEIFPGEPVSCLSEYVALMKKIQSGDMMGACAAAGIDMMQFALVSQRWGQKIATDPALGARFSNMLSGQSEVPASTEASANQYFQQNAVVGDVMPHVIVNEQLGLVLHIQCDYTKTTTHLSLLKPTLAGFELIKQKSIDELLLGGASVGDHWVVSAMKVRKLGQPAYVEEWDWQSLEPIKKHLIIIQNEKFFFNNFAISPNHKTVLVDRYWPPEERTTGYSRIYSFPEWQELGVVQMPSNLLSPTFSETGDKLVYVHTNQGSGEAHLLELKGGSFEEVNEFADREIGTDYTYTATAFTPQGIFILKLYGAEIETYLFSESGDSLKWNTTLATSFWDEISSVLMNDEFDFEELGENLYSTKLFAHTDATHAYVGGVGKIYQIDLVTGVVTKTIPVPGLSLIVQVRKLGDLLIVVDHQTLLAKVNF